jgi:hypothetical protein
MGVLGVVGNVELVTAWLLVVLFLAHYVTVVRWRDAKRSLTSWYLLGSNLSWALILGLGVLTLAVGQFPARDVIRVGIYALIVGKFATQYVLLVDSTRRRHKEGEPNDGGNADSGEHVWPGE